MTHPYSGLEDFCFWSRAMTRPGPSQIDPCAGGHAISATDKVATVGSCFAQHLARYIRKSGLQYYVAEQGPADISPQEALRRNYGVFSARYGNVYTVKQLVQLFDRAFGSFDPEESVWEKDGRLVDPFRSQVEPDGFTDEAELHCDRMMHLGYVRNVFTEADFIIFTLGLTEGWRSKRDGAVYPVAPGVSGGAFDNGKHEFVNFGVAETVQDLECFVEKVTQVNPGVHIILTVSPVPLIATYEKRHVWVSTTYSKAVLRVAADAAEQRFPNVVYFPSYEIITSPAAQGRYYADDLRQVTELGVKHVMRVFSRHFFPHQGQSEGGLEEITSARIQQDAGVVCDEETIELAMQQKK